MIENQEKGEGQKVRPVTIIFNEFQFVSTIITWLKRYRINRNIYLVILQIL